MNHGGQDMYYQHHMSAGSAPQAHTVTSYGQQQHQPLLQPSHAQYPPPTGYGYGYPNGLASPNGAPVGNHMGAPNVLPLPQVGSQPSLATYQGGFDQSGQVQPQGMKPRVTATLWEDEGSLCFQVEARGICVARREDNHMINGTKLLNVAGMTRGRRDGILKSEKVRHVVKIGPMHLKGVWIPFERALDFANKEKITELLYPLFVHNIGALLYHPTNQTQTSQVMAANERRKQDMRGGHGGQVSGLPSLHQRHPQHAQHQQHHPHHQQQHHHHHHPPAMPLPGPSPMQNMGRPSLDRAHTFPTPPTSASGLMSNMGQAYEWGTQTMSTTQPANTISIDTALGNARSMPATPATTPPGTGNSMPNLPYRQGYALAPQQSPYPPTSSPQDRPLYGQSYVKSEMGPPARSGEEETKAVNEDEAEHEQDNDHDHDHDQAGEYTHDSGAYDAGRAGGSYSYTAPTSLANEQHLAQDMDGPSHQTGSGRATPRTAPAPATYYSQGYHTPPRTAQQSSNLYSVMSNERQTNGGSDGYGTDMSNPMQGGYTTQAAVNGPSAGMKRGRDDDDDDDQTPTNNGAMSMGIKRRKTLVSDGSIPSPTYTNPPAMPAMPAMPGSNPTLAAQRQLR